MQRKHSLNLLGIFLGVALFFWGVWQRDILLEGWRILYWETTMMSGPWKMGFFYDYSLLLNFVFLVLSAIFMWYGKELSTRNLSWIVHGCIFGFLGTLLLFVGITFDWVNRNANAPFTVFWGLHLTVLDGYLLTTVVQAFGYLLVAVAVILWRD